MERDGQAQTDMPCKRPLSCESQLYPMKLRIQVKPNSRQEGVAVNPDGSLLVRVNAPPVEGQANARVIELLAEHLHVPRRNLRIVAGGRGRTKLVEVE